MPQVFLVGLGAGIAAALLFMAPIGGTLIAFPLFLLTALPIGIVGLGWGVIAAGVAAVAAAAIVYVAVSWIAATVFLLLFGAPIVWLARLALLSRPVDQGSPAGARQWYPIGGLLMHAAAAAAVSLVLTGLLIGFNPSALTREISNALVSLLASLQEVGRPPTVADVAPYVRFNVAVIPVTVGALMVFVLVIDLWLAAIVARASGRLAHPAQPLWTVVLPPYALIAFGVGVLMTLLLSGGIEEVGKVVLGAFGGAAALQGLAVLHALTRGMGGRGVLLAITYILIVLPGFPLVLFAIAGVAENFLQLRARRFRGAPPV